LAEPSLKFNTANGDRLIDAVMLFGGSLSPCNTGSRLIALSVSRMKRYWGLLGWSVVVLDIHGFRMAQVSAADDLDGRDSKLCYKSPGDRAYMDAYHRWYGHGSRPQCVTPPTLDLCDRTLAFWLTDALATSAHNGPVKLTAPRLRPQPASILAHQVRSHGFNAKVMPTSRYHAVELPASDRAKAQSWLSQYVPREVWEPEGVKSEPLDKDRG